jgi:hypothetical protein
LAWSLFAIAPRSYAAFFWLMVILNAAMVIASTSIGGLLVEAGQEGSATGRLASVRYGIDGVISVIAGPLGGWLAARAFGWTAGLGAMLLFSARADDHGAGEGAAVARRNLAVWSAAAVQFRLIVRSKTMWAARPCCCFVFMAPGFGIAMNYYQQDVLQFSTAVHRPLCKRWPASAASWPQRFTTSWKRA